MVRPFFSYLIYCSGIKESDMCVLLALHLRQEYCPSLLQDIPAMKPLCYSTYKRLNKICISGSTASSITINNKAEGLMAQLSAL